jgi:hypothetical protein
MRTEDSELNLTELKSCKRRLCATCGASWNRLRWLCAAVVHRVRGSVSPMSHFEQHVSIKFFSKGGKSVVETLVNHNMVLEDEAVKQFFDQQLVQLILTVKN